MSRPIASSTVVTLLVSARDFLAKQRLALLADGSVYKDWKVGCVKAEFLG
jgi:hypothetical protein